MSWRRQNVATQYTRCNAIQYLAEALGELEALKRFAPKESSVFFMMGQIYKRLGLLCHARDAKSHNIQQADDGRSGGHGTPVHIG